LNQWLIGHVFGRAAQERHRRVAVRVDQPRHGHHAARVDDLASVRCGRRVRVDAGEAAVAISSVVPGANVVRSPVAPSSAVQLTMARSAGGRGALVGHGCRT
jgi:hypothetical protein